MFEIAKVADDIEIENINFRPEKKIKILFYHAGGHQAWLYTSSLQLKTYIDLLYPELANSLEWLIPIQQKITDEELIAEIEKTHADVLCTSHYLWNHEFLISQLGNIHKKINANIKLIAGGPSINVNIDREFFTKYHFIDYAVYGAGEQAFADVMNHLVFNKPLIAFNTSNCAWKTQQGKTMIAEYKFVRMLETSPFLHNKEMFSTMATKLLQSNGFVYFPYTLTRGCPYSCTFCDWNSGLGNKVSRRKNTYQQEIDLFQQLGIKEIYLADANVGQYEEDIHLIEYLAQKNLNENAGFHVGGNYSKLKKENNLKIFHILAQSGLANKTFNFSIQDTNEQVLKNIDRPDVGWEVHAAMADELREKYPHFVVKAQLIFGLPGQTPETWRETLKKITHKNIYPQIFLNEPLPASPAIYNPEYQRKFQFEYVLTRRPLRADWRITENHTFYTSQIPKKCVSFDQAGLVKMCSLNGIYAAVTLVNVLLIHNSLPTIDIEFVVDDFLQSEAGQRFYNNLYNNWTVDNNFYYTINFTGQSQLTPVHDLVSHLLTNRKFLVYLAKFFPGNDKKTFQKLLVNQAVEKILTEYNSDND